MCTTDAVMKDPMPQPIEQKQRRGKRDKLPLQPQRSVKRKSRALEKHGNDAPSGGIESLLPSFIGVVILICGVMAKMGFRGRASVAGIDLGTTNSVVCVQAPAKGVGIIECLPDAATGSPIIPSVVSFLEPHERKVGPSSKIKSNLFPHPSHVVVGTAAKRRIDSHPHHTLYNAKRVLGRDKSDPSVSELQGEVEFQMDYSQEHGVYFKVPDTHLPIPAVQVGSYVIHHLIQITKAALGHDNIKSAVICVPAKFTSEQRQLTAQAFTQAGVSVARIVEEPTAAALAYGLHRKEGVDYILVYDFGGGTLDVSLLHVSDGFVDVMGSDGDDRLGGSDFDSAVANYLLKIRGGQVIVDQVTAALHRLQETLREGDDLEDTIARSCPALEETPLCTASSFHTLGEQIKIGLSNVTEPTDTVSAACYRLREDFPLGSVSLESFCGSLDRTTLILSKQEYDQAAQPLFARSILPVRRLLADLDLTHEDIDEVVMVGGTTRMPQIRELVREALPGSQLNTHIDPDITVAYGAASVID